MAFRYCPECDTWYETADYTVDESGETICRKDDHGAVHGYIDGSIRTVDDLLRSTSHRDMEDEIDAAVRQGLINH